MWKNLQKSSIMKKMKILYLITQSDLGGAQKYVLELSRALKKEFDIKVAAGKTTGELFHELEKENISYFPLKHLKRLPNPLGALFACLEIRRLIKKEKPDILHLNSTTAGFFGSLAARGLKTKVVYTVHGWAFLEPGVLKKIVFYLFEKTTAFLKDKFIVLSQYDKNIALKRNIAKENRLSVINNGIPQISFLSKEEAKKKLNISSQEPVVGVIANAYKTKGLSCLLKAYPQAVIIGDGPEKSKLQEQFPRALFLGKINYAAQYLKAFDIFCLPSLKEGFPFALLEAMQAGLPIIATKVGAILEIIENEKEGLLVEPKNSIALKEKIDYLLQNPEKAKTMAQNAFVKAGQYTREKMVEKTKNLYLNL